MNDPTKERHRISFEPPWGSQPTKCKGAACDAPIAWALVTGATGKTSRMPLDLRFYGISQDAAQGFEPHWPHCPNAHEFRSRPKPLAPSRHGPGDGKDAAGDQDSNRRRVRAATESYLQRRARR